MFPIVEQAEQQWWINGLLHREGNPAILYSDGTEKWCFNGKYHRENMPAVIYPHASEEWWRDGRLHRSDGLAVTVKQGYFIYHRRTGFSPFRKKEEITQYLWKSSSYRHEILQRMEAIELPISEMERTHTYNHGNKSTVFIYKDFGECTLEDQFWNRGKRIYK